MNARLLPAALAAVALCAAPAAAQPAPPSNLPGMKSPACLCPLTACDCGPVCPCAVPAPLPAGVVLLKNAAGEQLYHGPRGELATLAELQRVYGRVTVAGAPSVVPPTYTAPVGGTGFYGVPSFGSPCANGRCPVPVQYVR